MEKNIKILIADDEKIICDIIGKELSKNNYNVTLANDGKDAIDILSRNNFDIAVIDVKMPYTDGFEVLNYIRNSRNDLIVIMMTAFGSIDGAVKSMKMKANDYITKPFDVDELIEKIEWELKLKKSKLDISKRINTMDKYILIGKSDLMDHNRRIVNKIKDLETTVLITGESGTGKSVLGKQIHNLGKRKDFPFIHVDCASLPTNLVESELFGYEKGSFTNADSLKKGKLEIAGKGTVFLDEISTLPVSLQSRLLNVLQEHAFYRIGGAKKILVEARFIAATNEDLENAVIDGRFREDLYYRLNVVRLECPPLRAHKEDIIDIAKYFIEQNSQKLGKKTPYISDEVWDLFLSYSWPGNVRELENTIENIIIMLDNDIITLENLPTNLKNNICKNTNDSNEEKDLTLKEKELLLIIEALDKHDGHRQKTADELGISRRTLQYKLKKYNLT